MKPHKIQPEAIAEMLRKYRTGSRSYDLCRQYHISESTLMVWKRKYYGMNANQIRVCKLPLFSGRS